MGELTKQDAGKNPSNVERDGFSAEELAKQSIYEDESLLAREMLRGNETEGEPANEKDVTGKAGIKEWDQRQVQENKREE